MREYIDLREKSNLSELKKIGNEMKKGKIAVFPTETVYGIGTNGLDSNAVEKIYKIKNRSKDNPINLLVSNIEMAELVAENISELEYKLMKKFFPGPFTIILKKKKGLVSDVLTAGKDTIGIRIPDNEIALKLIEYAGCPIATSSANFAGENPKTKIESVTNDFYKDVDYVIDGGECNIGIASTIVQVEDGKIHILRQGYLTINGQI